MYKNGNVLEILAERSRILNITMLGETKLSQNII